MAVSADPLRRDAIAVQAEAPTQQLQAPASNGALQLAGALADLEPTVHQALQGYAVDQQAKLSVQARKDALTGNAATVADGVRDGKLLPTQNPWYMEAYNKEAASRFSQDDMAGLQTASASWPERNDPAAFSARWHTEMGQIAQKYQGKDAAAGFLPVANMFTQQALQANTAQNIQRITTERKTNLTALATADLERAAAANGGALSGNQATAALAGAHAQWVGTGGTETEWGAMSLAATQAAATNTGNGDLAKVAFGMSPFGAGAHPDGDHVFGDGALDSTPPPPPAPLTTTSGLTPHSTADARLYTPALEMQESGGKFVISNKGAVGPRQLEPSTARQWARQMGKGPEYAQLALTNTPEGMAANRAIGDFGIQQLSDQYDGNPVAALAAYNAGPHHPWITANMTQADIPARFAETQHYVKTILNHSNLGDTAALPLPLSPTAQTPLAEQTPAFTPSGEPSLADLPGAATQISQTQYYADRVQKEKAQQRVTDIKAQQQAQGEALLNDITAAYGTGIYTGTIPASKYIALAQSKGYGRGALDYALNSLNSATSDARALTDAGKGARNLDPDTQDRLAALAMEGRTNPAPDYEQRVTDEVRASHLTWEEAGNLVGNAVATGRWQAAHAPGFHIKNGQQLTQAASGQADQIQADVSRIPAIASRVAQGAEGDDVVVPGGTYSKYIRGVIKRAQDEYLAIHPGDYTGAFVAGRGRGRAYEQWLAIRLTTHNHLDTTRGQ